MTGYVVRMGKHHTNHKHPILKVVLPEDRILLIRRSGRIYARKLKQDETYEEVVKIHLPHNAGACAEMVLQASGKLKEMLKSIADK